MCLPLLLVGSGIIEIHGQNGTNCCSLSMFQNGGDYTRNKRDRSSSNETWSTVTIETCECSRKFPNFHVLLLGVNFNFDPGPNLPGWLSGRYRYYNPEYLLHFYRVLQKYSCDAAWWLVIIVASHKPVHYTFVANSWFFPDIFFGVFL